MSKSKDLQEEFLHYVEVGNSMPPQTADNMLIAYAFFKQATQGDNTNDRPTESSNVVQTFKHDAWMRLQGMPKEEAMRKYIATIKEFLKQSKKEDLSS